MFASSRRSAPLRAAHDDAPPQKARLARIASLYTQQYAPNLRESPAPPTDPVIAAALRPLLARSEPRVTDVESTTTGVVALRTTTNALTRANDSTSTSLVRPARPHALVPAHVANEIHSNALVTLKSNKLNNARDSTDKTPTKHPQWKLMRVIAGHQGWVKALAVDHTNTWFASGGGDRVIKIWDLASGVLKLTLTGHIATVSALAISDRHPYLFSAGHDKTLKCWDLETNKVVRHYHGHLSGIFSLALHPTLDVLVSGGRDSTARVWDMRTKAQIFALTGHRATVAAVACQALDPQVITGSMDSTVRLWDLAAGKTLTTLTHHRKSVRALALHPSDFSFASASADAIKQFAFPNGDFVRDFAGHTPEAIVNTLSVNQDGVVFCGGDDGKMVFGDWATGRDFQHMDAISQPGSLESESGIFCSTFDMTGSRLITGEADKSIKIFKEVEV